jgi:HEPN domain-containing protein
MRRLRRKARSGIAPSIVWNRQDFRALALLRLEEARVLLKNDKYDGAYYLCGYVVECALKACIARQTDKHDFPPKRDVINEIYKHEISSLMRASGLQTKLDKFVEKTKDMKLERNYSYVLRWNEESRYLTHSKRDAKDLFNAIANNKHGVLMWIKHHW